MASEFAEWLRQNRKARGLSMNALAKKAGLKSHVHVSMMERDLARPSPEMVAKLAAALEVDPSPGLRARYLPEEERGLRRVRLSTGDEIAISEADPEPEETIRATEAFLRAWREGRGEGFREGQEEGK